MLLAHHMSVYMLSKRKLTHSGRSNPNQSPTTRIIFNPVSPVTAPSSGASTGLRSKSKATALPFEEFRARRRHSGNDETIRNESKRASVGSQRGVTLGDPLFISLHALSHSPGKLRHTVEEILIVHSTTQFRCLKNIQWKRRPTGGREGNWACKDIGINGRIVFSGSGQAFKWFQIRVCICLELCDLLLWRICEDG